MDAGAVADAGTHALRVEVLGPVRAWLDGTEVDLGSAMRKAVFAALAVRPGRTVSRADLVDALWADEPPASAAGLISTYVAGLRRVLEPDRRGAGFELLTSSREGYRLRLDDEECDATAFEAHLRLARELGRTDPQAAADAFAAALARWRGTPLAGVPGPFADAERDRLTEAYFDAVEHRAEALLALGRDTEAAGELTALLEERPLREQPAGLLMTALHRLGRSAEAHAVYARLSDRLAEQVGIDPGAGLQHLHRRIADDDPALRAAPRSGQRAGRLVPAQLPHDTTRFTGRPAELARLLAEPAGGPARETTPMTLITGSAGIGKTALAVHAAHRLRASYPDGQLFVDLRGFDPEQPPLRSTEALTHCLRSLGVDPKLLPADEAELAARYRSVLSGLRVLLVLDNAASSDQVRPLLPGVPACGVLATSRNQLSGLSVRDGFRRIELPLLGAQESERFLDRAIGEDRASAEPGVTTSLARLCGYLPLALSIAAERVVGQPNLLLADVVADLADEHDRLDTLAVEDDPGSVVRAVFSWSYHALKPETAQFFRLLGLHPGPEFTTPVAAALTGTPLALARRLLGTLAAGHLIDVVERDRYRLHDLMRLYARELTTADDGEQRRLAATRRVLAWYLHSADAATRILFPIRNATRLDLGTPPEFCEPRVFDGYPAALDWAQREHATLLACLDRAEALGLDEIVYQLPSAMVDVFYLRRDWNGYVAVHEKALAAARRAGNRRAETRLAGGLGIGYTYDGRPEEGIEVLLRARRQSLLQEDPVSTGICTLGIALANVYAGRPKESVDHFHDARDIFSALGDQSSEALVLSQLGATYAVLGRYDRAISLLEQGLALCPRGEQYLAKGFILFNLGDAFSATGERDRAIEYYERAVDHCREVGDLFDEARAQRSLAKLLEDRGDAAAAAAALAQAFEIAKDIGDIDEIQRHTHAARPLA